MEVDSSPHEQGTQVGYLVVIHRLSVALVGTGLAFLSTGS